MERAWATRVRTLGSSNVTEVGKHGSLRDTLRDVSSMGILVSIVDLVVQWLFK